MMYYTAIMENASLNTGEQPKGLRINDGTHWKTALKMFKEYCKEVKCGGTLYSNNIETEEIMNNWEVEYKEKITWEEFFKAYKEAGTDAEKQSVVNKLNENQAELLKEYLQNKLKEFGYIKDETDFTGRYFISKGIKKIFATDNCLQTVFEDNLYIILPLKSKNKRQ